MSNLSVMKPKTASEKQTKTVVDTLEVTPDAVKKWLSPPFQRPVRENEKVRALSEELKSNGGVWPGIVTLGSMDGRLYIIDGQHRRAAFILSGLTEGYTDVRIHHVDSMATMGEEFVLLNSQLVRLRPDDMLRGLEDSLSSLRNIRKRCPFVGYDMIRRGPKAPIVSMATILRIWKGSQLDVPTPGSNGMSTVQLASSLTEEDVDQLCDFLGIALEAFGRDDEFHKLWGSLNLILCMWLYRRLVVTQYSQKTPRLSKEMFRKGMTSLSASNYYLDWLVGRNVSDRDRSPAYGRIKLLFSQRISEEVGKRIMLPKPAWDSSNPAHLKV